MLHSVCINLDLPYKLLRKSLYLPWTQVHKAPKEKKVNLSMIT